VIWRPHQRLAITVGATIIGTTKSTPNSDGSSVPVISGNTISYLKVSGKPERTAQTGQYNNIHFTLNFDKTRIKN
jgi:hypothetical protein